MTHLRRLTVAMAGLVLLAGCGAAEPQESAAPVEQEQTEEPDEPVQDEGPEPEPEEEEEPEPEPEPEPAPEGPDGSRDNPMPIGTSATVGDWEVTITAVDLDATETVLAENPYNEDSENGRFVLVSADATYHGDDEGMAWDLYLVLIGNDARHYSNGDCWAVIPDDIGDEPTVETGGSISGNWCLDVPDDALDGAELFLEDFTNWDNEVRIFWSLRP